jgi:hypothetical protein
VGPDFRVGWHAETDSRLEVEDITDAYGYGWRVWYGPGWATFVPEYDEGTLVLDFVDMQRNELAWRGVAEGRLRRPRPTLPTQPEVDRAVEEIIDAFPVRGTRRAIATR